jgi:dTDP-4-dehydrorhamnose reductase
MKILVTGANGQLGNEIRRLVDSQRKDEFVFTDVEELDICNKEKVEEFVISNKIDLIVNCAAYTAVDRAENEKELAYRINRDALLYLSKAINKRDGVLIHISTDFVFDGSKSTPYKEGDVENPLSVYGRSKFEGEKVALNEAKSVYIVRTSWLYSTFGHNFVKTIIRKAKEKKELKVVFDQVGTPTYAKDLASAILLLIKNVEKNQQQIFHFSNEGVTSWYDFAKMICKIGKIEGEILPIETKDYPTPARRPAYSVLNKTKIKEFLGINIPYWVDSLEVCLKELNT